MNFSPLSPTAAEPRPTEKETWTPPVLQKMDVEETALGNGLTIDADGMS